MEDNQFDKAEAAEPELTDSEALPPNQERALRALLTAPSRKEAARAAGVSDSTLWRYTRDEAFARRLREAHQEIVGHAALRLRCESEGAVAVLAEIMKERGAPAFARIAAARSVLDYTIRVGEMEELRRRVEELEDFIKTRQEEAILDAALRREEEASGEPRLRGEGDEVGPQAFGGVGREGAEMLPLVPGQLSPRVARPRASEAEAGRPGQVPVPGVRRRAALQLRRPDGRRPRAATPELLLYHGGLLHESGGRRP